MRDHKQPGGPVLGHLSSREISKRFGISRSNQWRARKIAEIPEAEFEAMIEGPNPPTVTALVNFTHKPAVQSTALRQFQRTWRRLPAADRAAFIKWLEAQTTE